MDKPYFAELSGMKAARQLVKWWRLSVLGRLVPSDSVDVVVSNCVLNLVDAQEKPKLFAEIFRVLKRGGRAVISDIVSDESVPEHLQNDPELWSGCISGALTEQGFLEAFQQAGFHGIELVKFETQPASNGLRFCPPHPALMLNRKSGRISVMPGYSKSPVVGS